jgi:hypothetical protein
MTPASESRKAELMALAEKVAALSGPDRGVDAAIAVAIDWRFAGYEDGDLTPKGMAEKNGLPWLADRVVNSIVTIWRHIPNFTASLDAAMSLAGDWFIAQMGDLAADGLPGVCLCIDTNPVRHVWGVASGYDASSARLARAYTAAALRALAESEQ